MSLGVIDIGGTTIKFAYWDGQKLRDKKKAPTPDNLDDFMEVLKANIDEFKAKYNIQGVAVSSPGAINKKTGVIEGASALPYIHNFEIVSLFEDTFKLPVSIENDANCAALAEVADGAGKDNSNLVFLVIGTGVGGAIIINKQIYHGSHLYGGEFGFQLMNQNTTLSQACSPVTLATRYNEISGESVTGKDVFDKAQAGETLAVKLVDQMITQLATAIYNLQHTIDPEKIIIGGAISQNQNLIPMINVKIKEIQDKVEIATLTPVIETCKYTADANLRGAVVDFDNENHN